MTTERTKLRGYEVVFYHKGYRLHAGNPQIFPVRKPAEIYKKHYEEYPWIDHEVCIEETEYEGIPLLSLIHISEPTRLISVSRMPSSA